MTSTSSVCAETPNGTPHGTYLPITVCASRDGNTSPFYGPRPNYRPHDEGRDISPFFYGTYRYIQARSAEADSLLASRVIGSHWYRQARTSFAGSHYPQYAASRTRSFEFLRKTETPAWWRAVCCCRQRSRTG